MKAFLITALVLLPTFAQAGVPEEINAIEATYTACLAEDDSNLGQRGCALEANSSADDILNREYRAFTAKLKKDNTEENREVLARLVTAQRAWISFRDANCSLLGAQMLGGSGENTIIAGCQYVATKNRVLELNNIYEGLLPR